MAENTMKQFREYCTGVIRLIRECLGRSSRVLTGRLTLRKGRADTKAQDGKGS